MGCSTVLRVRVERSNVHLPPKSESSSCSHVAFGLRQPKTPTSGSTSVGCLHSCPKNLSPLRPWMELYDASTCCVTSFVCKEADSSLGDDWTAEPQTAERIDADAMILMF